MTQAIEAVGSKIVAGTPAVRQTTNPQKTAPATHTEASKTTVSLSNAALLAAAKEAAETPVQTAKEARGNDRQAQRLLAKEAAAHRTN